MIHLWVEGKRKYIEMETDTPSAGWEHLTDMVGDYLESMGDDESLSHEYDKWEMFRDDLRARSLKPWDDFSLIEAPSKRLWGVEKG